MSSIFYNTVSFDGETLLHVNAKAAKQGDLIKAIFEANPTKKFSPSQILELIQSRYGLNWPITSVRRAMTDLASPKCDDVLLKTAELTPSPYGSMEHLWILRAGNERHEPEKADPGPGFGVFMADLGGKPLEQQKLF